MQIFYCFKYTKLYPIREYRISWIHNPFSRVGLSASRNVGGEDAVVMGAHQEKTLKVLCFMFT